MEFLIIIILAILTIKYLPFINLDASLRLQEWAKEMIKNLEDNADKQNHKDKK
jgi:hypothetical protein